MNWGRLPTTVRILRRRTHDVAAHPELLRLEPQREAHELRQVQHGHLQLAPDHALGERLL